MAQPRELSFSLNCASLPNSSGPPTPSPPHASCDIACACGKSTPTQSQYSHDSHTHHRVHSSVSGTPIPPPTSSSPDSGSRNHTQFNMYAKALDRELQGHDQIIHVDIDLNDRIVFAEACDAQNALIAEVHFAQQRINSLTHQVNMYKAKVERATYSINEIAHELATCLKSKYSGDIDQTRKISGLPPASGEHVTCLHVCLSDHRYGDSASSEHYHCAQNTAASHA